MITPPDHLRAVFWENDSTISLSGSCHGEMILHLDHLRAVFDTTTWSTGTYLWWKWYQTSLSGSCHYRKYNTTSLSGSCHWRNDTATWSPGSCLCTTTLSPYLITGELSLIWPVDHLRAVFDTTTLSPHLITWELSLVPPLDNLGAVFDTTTW